jgi:hypothetical protein
MIPGTLDVHIAQPLVESSTLDTALRLTISYSAARAHDVLEARMPVVFVTFQNGQSARMSFGGTFDTAARTVTVDVPKAALNGAVDVRLGLATDASTYTLPPPGPRYWNGKSWSQSGSILPGKRTLVLIHGIFSSVETAFKYPIAAQIGKAGQYQQIVGFDYDWTEPPSVEGPIFAKFLNDLVSSGVTTFDIEAHSYGSPVTYAALPYVKGAKIPNVVTLGGPLPLRGTPLAAGYYLRLVLVDLADIFVGPPSLINHAYESGMVASLGTNSSEMKAILSGINALPQKPDFIDIAGTKEYPQEFLVWPVLWAAGVHFPWDGIVEQLAANSDCITNSYPNKFYEEHTELEGAGTVIAYVGQQVLPDAKERLHAPEPASCSPGDTSPLTTGTR